MGKLSKADVKLQKQVLEIYSKPNLTIDDIDFVYENYNPGYDVNVSEKGVYFTPIDLAGDNAVFCPKGNLNYVDVCGGIGLLSFKLICMNYYEKPIKSITIIELNNHFCEMGKKLICSLSGYNQSVKYDNAEPTKINYVNASMYNKEMWEEITSTLPNQKFDVCISNPPYGKCSAWEKEEAHWLNYKGERELMALELAHKFSNEARFILPQGSCEFQFSGRPYYDRRPNNKIDRFRKANPEMFFCMECDGIDGSLYTDSWKGTKILTEVANISFDKSEYE